MKRWAGVLLASLLLLVPLRSFAQEVSTSAKACVIIDEISGRILLSHNADTPLPMASTTKVMTALLALENCSLDEMVTCSRNAYGIPGTSIYLSEGETLSMAHMLYGLMLASGNDAAVAIAEHVGGSTAEFCRMMTERAAELGCINTVFLTPHGLPQEGHYTTAADLALIAREAMTHPFFRELVSTRRATIPWEDRTYDRVLNNKNRLLSEYEGATGIKTGYTKKAGRCLVFGAQRDGMRIIGVVLNCSDWFDEAARLMDRAFEQYESVTLLTEGEAVGQLAVHHTDGQYVNAIAGKDLSGVVPKDAAAQVELQLPESLEAPVIRGEIIGRATLVHNGIVIGECPIVADASVLRDDAKTRVQRYMQNWLLIP